MIYISVNKSNAKEPFMKSIAIYFLILLTASLGTTQANDTLNPRAIEHTLSKLINSEGCHLDISEKVNLNNNEYLSIIANDNNGNKLYFSTLTSKVGLPLDLRELGYFFEAKTVSKGMKYVLIKNEYTDTTFGSPLKTLETLVISSDFNNTITAVTYKRTHEKNGWFSSKDVVDEIFNCER